MAVLVVATLAVGLAARAQPTHPWEVVEITLEASGEHTNAYVQGLPDRSAPLAQVAFTGTSGAARDMRYTLAAFWDGGKTWKTRFAPPAPGEWSWSSASKDPGLAAVTGKIQVAEWTEAEKQVSEYPAPFCGAIPGDLYVLYVRYGGRLKVDLWPSQATDRFEYTWFDLEQGKERTRGNVNGGAAAEFHTPEDYPGNLLFKDWLLHIRRAER
jgi:hypothetical protein